MNFYKSKSLAQRLDALAFVKIRSWDAPDQVHRRRFRWLPILVLIVASGDLAYALLNPHRYWVADEAMPLCFTIGILLNSHGPLKPTFTLPDGVDEYDINLKRDATRVGYATTSVTAAAGIVIIVFLAVFQNLTRAALVQDLLLLLWYLLTLFAAVPTLYASWAQPAPVAEDE